MQKQQKKETVNKIKIHLSEWEKLFANKVTKDSSSKYKKAHGAQYQKNNQLNEKMAKDMPGGPLVKNPTANAGDMSLIPPLRRFHVARGN